MASSAKINPAPSTIPTLSIVVDDDQFHSYHMDDDHIDHDDTTKIKVDSIFETLGSFGRFQKLQFFLICIPMMFVSMHVFSWTFMVTPARKTCPTLIFDNSTFDNSTFGLSNSTFHECEEQAYAASDRWNMSGENSWIRATVQSVYFIGQMVGSFSCGIMADKIGRKKVIFICLVVQVTCAVLLIFAPTWWLYAALKCVTGFTQPGIFGVSVVLGIELVGPKYRSWIAVIGNLFGAAGSVVLAVLAYFILDYRYLHAAIAIPSLIFLTYKWIVYESARWLVSQEKYDEANVVIFAAARMNKKTIPSNWMENVERAEKISLMKKKKSSFGVYDLIRTPQMRKRTLTNFLMWPTTTMMYYGLTMKSDVGGGNIFITFITSSLVEIPSILLIFFLIDRFGRKKLYCGTIFSAGLLLLINWLLTGIIPDTCAIALLLASKGAVTIAYTTMYTYTSELFPTVIRNTAVGCCSTMARFGAIFASFVAFVLVDRFGKIVMILPFTVLAFSAALVAFIMLPETMNRKLPDSISEVEGQSI